MKKTVILFGILAILAFAASCETQIDIQSDPVEPQAEQITITASINEALTKVAFTAGTDGSSMPIMELAWEAGDELLVADHANPESNSLFTLSSGAGEKTAVFTGTPVSASSYDVSVVHGDVTYNAQTQAADGDASGLVYIASKSDITDLSGITFDQVNSVLGIIAKMPSTEVAAKIKSVNITASDNIFNGGNALSITLSSIGDTDGDGILNLYATLPVGNQAIPAGSTLLMKFNAPGEGHDVYTRLVEIPSAVTLTSGRMNSIKVNCSQSANHAGAVTCDGSNAAKAYLIGDKYQMQAMSSLLVAGEIKYFTMIDDVNMAGVAWTSLNSASSYNKGVYFEGNNHTISNFSCVNQTYAGFFGVLYGTCKNVIFTDASISQNVASACGILAGYAGSGDLHADIINVHVEGSVTMTGNKTGIGGLVGTVGNATIDACSADCTVSSTKNYVGGLFGYSKKVSVTNCWTSGSVRGDQRVGGICGGINGEGDSIVNCFSTANLDGGAGDYSASRSVGGIVGHANLDKGDSNKTRTPGNVVSGCIAWQEAIKTRSYYGATCGSNDLYSSGAIVAFTATQNTLSNCYRRADLDFRDYADSFLLYDQADASSSSPLVIEAVDGCTHNYPYHGKAAAAGKTLSEVAQDLGWSSSVWDLTGATPSLK